MPTLNTSLPSIGFPHEFDAIEIDSPEALNIALLIDGNAILQTTLHQDEREKINLYDLASLIRNYVSEGIHTLEISPFEDEYIILPCSQNVSVTALQFIASFFFSPLLGEKKIFPAAQEYLSFYSEAREETMIITSLWQDAEGNVITHTGSTAVPIAEGEGIVTIDVSPNCITPPTPSEAFPPLPLPRLLNYTVTIGGRKQNYTIVPDESLSGRKPISLEFFNCFGVRDTFHFFGLCKRTLQSERQSAMIRGRLHNYDVQAIPEWEAFTGGMDGTIIPLLDDLCATCLPIRNLITGSDVIITGCDYITNDDLYELSEASITFRETSMVRSWQSQIPVRTFDETFDNTFL